jgi:2-phosphosulfolactate phosphatase
VDPYDQSRYQVRTEWGADGLARLAPADIVVVVDVLLFSSDVADAVDRGVVVGPVTVSGAAQEPGIGAEDHRIAARAAASGALVILGSLRNAAAVADAVLAEQHRRAGRTSVAVIAAGERDGERTRFAVEDQLGAGAVIDALAARGIDHTSPEAAAACEAFRGLRPAVRHLLTASGSGQRLLADGHRDRVLAAAQLDDLTAVPVLHDGVYRAL